ncbi:MAG: hypothetical protein HXY27_03945 [Hydrogenophilaceae bacterium]|nr:hypothetical protein [Hydrogenophilaceae bacterium]
MAKKKKLPPLLKLRLQKRLLRHRLLPRLRLLTPLLLRLLTPLLLRLLTLLPLRLLTLLPLRPHLLRLPSNSGISTIKPAARPAFFTPCRPIQTAGYA